METWMCKRVCVWLLPKGPLAGLPTWSCVVTLDCAWLGVIFSFRVIETA